MENNSEQLNNGQTQEIKVEERNPVIGFFEDNKKWFVIGGCFLAGVLLGGAGTMMINKESSESETDEPEA